MRAWVVQTRSSTYDRDSADRLIKELQPDFGDFSGFAEGRTTGIHHLVRDELVCMAFGLSSETITKKERKARRSLFAKRHDFLEIFSVRRIANALQAKGCKIGPNSSWDIRNGWDANNGDHRRTLWDTNYITMQALVYLA